MEKKKILKFVITIALALISAFGFVGAGIFISALALLGFDGLLVLGVVFGAIAGFFAGYSFVENLWNWWWA